MGRDTRREIVRGIGDDCAVLRLPANSQLLVTTDLCIEGVHFRREWHPAHSVGHRCLARGLSDIAAMGGEPVACFLSLGLPARMPKKWADEFVRGLLHLARQFNVSLAGGDTSGAERVVADIVVLGAVPANEAVLRSGACPGDCVYITGDLGGSAAVVKSLYSKKAISPGTERRHFYPAPRVEIGHWLRRRKFANAMIDVSDGLSVDLAHLCQESGVSAVIDESAIPIARGATLDSALHGGEDYELLFTVPATAKLPAKIDGVVVTMIGRIQPGSAGRFAVHIRDHGGRIKQLKPQGWQHFTKK
ncbi:MAG TPA: thiamine-phosphate kinase [Candidatus Angelobacter sp.]